MPSAARPVVLFGNGLGDHLTSLPALRALARLFRGRLALVSLPGAADLFFRGVRLRTVCETDMRTYGAGKVFDAARVAQAVGPADLFLSLNPWHSGCVDDLLDRLGAPPSVGFHRNFKTHLARDYSKHTADLAFDLPRCFAPALEIGPFARPPLLSRRARERARRIRTLVPSSMRVLAVHADTGLWTPDGSRRQTARVNANRVLGNKMWAPQRFTALLDAFLSRHDDFMAFVLGAVDLGLDAGRHGERVVSCCRLPLDVSFALLAGADLFVGVDSCMLHAADLCRIPGLGLFGPTDPREFGFRFAPHVHLSGGAFMDGIAVEAALAALESLLPQAADDTSCRAVGSGADEREPRV